jgi:hypothetical protein
MMVLWIGRCGGPGGGGWRSEAEGGDGRWGRDEATARRVAPPVDGWRRGREASSVAVGAAVLLFFVLMVIF